ncbi:MAG: type II secretion system F family protein [Candidatus Marsarchaeota archaeon]|jgi:type II secretory pathway component PulF|nr:type II secretion system F family protein [Candidatus Marsarchaeota archaeon]
MKINFERLVSRNVARYLSRLLDLAGSKMSVQRLLRMVIPSFFVLFIGVSIFLYAIHIGVLASAIIGLIAGLSIILVVYLILNYMIDKRKSAVEQILPDYFQITSANLRSGIALDRSMLLAARPEFTFFSEDVLEMNRKVFGGETFEAALQELGNKYRSIALQHAIKMMIEAQRYGGAMADLMDQLSKDLRNQQIVQKEVSGQLFMYSIFIAFAGLIAAPVLYGLTSQMIVVTNTVWKGILASNPGGLPTTGVSFLKPSPPKISTSFYRDFALVSIALVTGFAALIMSTISSGSTVRGIRLVPAFILIGLAIYFVVGSFIGSLFSSIGGV